MQRFKMCGVIKMKKIKYIIMFVLILVSLVITGDFFQEHLRHFENEYKYTTFALPHGTPQEEMISDMKTAAENRGVKFFFVDRKVLSTFEEKIIIYCSDESVKDEIKQKSYIEDGKYNSVFFGETNVSFESVEKIGDVNTFENCYLIGDYDWLYLFKLDLMDDYSGSLIKEAEKTKSNLVFVLPWILVISAFALITIYEIMVKRREHAVLLSFGEKNLLIILKNVFADVGVLIIMYLIGIVILYPFTNVLFGTKYALVAFLFMLLMDILIFLSVFKINIRYAFSGEDSTRGLLNIGFIFKGVVQVLVTVAVAMNFSSIYQACSFYSQKDFFQSKSSYNQFQTMYINSGWIDNETHHNNYLMYSEYFNFWDATVMLKPLDYKVLERDVLLYNKNAQGYLFDKINIEETEPLKEGTVTFFFPKKYFKNGVLKEEIEYLCENIAPSLDYGGKYTFDYDLRFYKNNVKLLSFSEEFYGKSDYTKNPIIAFVNIDESEMRHNIAYDQNIGCSKFIMYNASADEVEKAAQKYNNNGLDINVLTENVYSQYQNYWSVLRKTLYINSVLSILFILLDMVITFYIIKLDYYVNATELALKKVLGYSSFERHRTLLISSVFISICSIAAAYILNFSIKFSGIIFLLCGGVLFSFLDLLMILFIIRKIEKERIQKILKGGAL